MTQSDENKPDDENSRPEASQALTPAVSETTGVDPFIAAASEKKAEVEAPRPFRAKLLDYSAHAAIIVGLLGFAWTVGDHVMSRPSAPKAPLKVAAVPEKPKVDEMAELRKANTQMASDLRSLRASLDSLRAVVKQDKSTTQVRALEASLDGIKSGLSLAKSETNSAIAQLSGKIDKLQRDPQSKMQQLVDRLGRLEHQTVDTTSTGSIQPAQSSIVAKNVPTPPAKPAMSSAAKAEYPKGDMAKGDMAKADLAKDDLGDDRKVAMNDDGKPDVLTGWVVRDVYDGVALVEGRRGPMEVVPGVNIPGAGVVKSIDRHGNGWTVTTSKGLLAYAAPPREYRRSRQRDFYPPPYRYY